MSSVGNFREITKEITKVVRETVSQVRYSLSISVVKNSQEMNIELNKEFS